MKVHTCNICGQEINKDNPAPTSPLTSGFVQADKVLPFEFELRVTNWSFDAKDFDVCNGCLLSAVGKPLPVQAPAPAKL